MNHEGAAFKAGQQLERSRLQQIIQIRIDQLSRTPRSDLLCAELLRLHQYLNTP